MLSEAIRQADGAISSPIRHALGDVSLEERARVFKAFCDPHRIQLLHLLRYGEFCASGLLKSLFVSQPTLSHHMKILQESGIVNQRIDGRKTFYSLNFEGLDRAEELMNEFRNPLQRVLYRDYFCEHAEGSCDEVDCC